jgi:hypothetical protein
MPSPALSLRCSGCGWRLNATPYLDPRTRELPESHMALHLSARPNCLAEYRELGKVEWLFIEPLLEFRRCKTVGGANRGLFAKYPGTLMLEEAERVANRKIACATVAVGGNTERAEEESPSPHSRVPQASHVRGQLPEGYVRHNKMIGRMIEVGSSGLLAAAGGTIRPVLVRDAWRIGFVDVRRGSDRWAGKFESEAAVREKLSDAKLVGKWRAQDAGLKFGPVVKGGWRG